MSNAEQQIVELARRGLSAEEIAASLGYELETVAVVLRKDGEVREAIEKADNGKLEAEFTALEKLAFKTMEDIMRYGEKESARQAAAAYVLDQRLGLKAPKAGITFNLFDFNERLKEVRDRKKALDVESEKIVPMLANG